MFSLFVTLFAFGVVLLGAYTRLSDAGLGCPDWPGCYAKYFVPLSATKALTEMTHRYFAGILGLFILMLALWAPFRKKHFRFQPVIVPWLLVALVCFQAVLGMWTVTMKLLPVVVMGHLLGGMIIVTLLWWLTMASKPNSLWIEHGNNHLRLWAALGLLIVFIQIFLGVWTSSNYAALACPNFPFCHGTLFPNMEWRTAFNFLSPVGPNYEGGRLAMDARVTIQMAHRYGAFITALYLLPFSFYLVLARTTNSLRKYGWIILLLLGIQIVLGVLNIELLLPTSTALAHTGVAALLLLTLVTVIYKLFYKS